MLLQCVGDFRALSPAWKGDFESNNVRGLVYQRGRPSVRPSARPSVALSIGREIPSLFAFRLSLPLTRQTPTIDRVQQQPFKCQLPHAE